MERRFVTAKILTAAIGLAAAAPVIAAAQTMTPTQQANKMKMATEHLQKCYGVNAIGRNDCAAGAHSCAGQATMARDPASFVLLPQGDCEKIAGGSLTPGKA
ncbi:MULTISPECIES: DUF2282 domain-containing protein [Acidocella]|uniref:BufA1 family periplasmic bufferin-type metallophore n=1 Tax=Acidocella TaxID=50709 RepID=UPI00028EC0EE|nr:MULTISPECIES: DUF2282 domain-containing protein [Acidocella]EKM98597.1 hypothetical protein MXAZACID_14558 [Acidocella sp. MX-AZ02]WBO58917.1 DUF2282 domain-containing protein [Acidocella sp. MX-AZ03]